MSTDTSRRQGHGDAADLRETARTIEDAIRLSRARNYRFLTYLLEMARLETTNLIGSKTASRPTRPADRS